MLPLPVTFEKEKEWNKVLYFREKKRTLFINGVLNYHLCSIWFGGILLGWIKEAAIIFILFFLIFPFVQKIYIHHKMRSLPLTEKFFYFFYQIDLNRREYHQYIREMTISELKRLIEKIY
jgi:hypothetical protein